MSPLRSDVALVPLGFEHAERMCAWMAEPLVREGIGLRDSPSLEKTRAWIRRALEDPSVRAFAILQGGEHVGNVVLDRIDAYLRTARLSLYVGEPAARGGGVGRTAVRLAAGRAFADLGLHKLWLTVHAENFAAIGAYHRAGFLLEGILRDEFLLEGRRLAVLYMGLLREDFHRAGPEGAS